MTTYSTNDLEIVVRTHHGPARESASGWTRESRLQGATIHASDVRIDPYEGGSADDVIGKFQRDYACKVSYLEDDDRSLRSFDVFEPSWADDEEAQRVGEDLVKRLIAATCDLTK